jgi:hypothetical protein
VDLVPAIAIGRTHDERRQEAALLDVFSKLVDRLLGKLGAWVVRVLVEHRYGQEQRPSVTAAGHGCGS